MTDSGSHAGSERGAGDPVGAADSWASKIDVTGERLVPEANAGELVHAEHIARYLLAGRLAPGRRVLDIACGEGYGTALLGQAGARSVVGVDIDAATVEHARARYGGEFLIGDAAALELPDASADLIVSFETIEHVERPDAVLDQFRRVLAPDGVLLISTPNAQEYRVENPFHVRELAPSEFLGTLRQRFEHVRPLYQQNLLLSAILDEQGLTEADAARARPWLVAKLAGVPAGRQLYTLALCGRAELPPLAVDLAAAAAIYEAHELAQRVDSAERLVGEWSRRAQAAERNEADWIARASQAEKNLSVEKGVVQAWVRRAAEAEGLVGAWNARAEEAERQLSEVRATLEAISRSVSWRATRPLRALRGRKRRSGAP